ncbi:hypothetical protein GCM10007096_29630 [Pullulanibacillus pueri]|uniref:Uncharacterized protein n=2 Tax=Pullulanibacillus pueri TaxID=1437324 RepID=A0A8J2ZXZ8_9BACL|nr:hypothetical protein GCM10007096_29630 [Pullulanibacillus pueri]
MGLPGLQVGETAEKKQQLMLRLNFSDITLYGLTIYKTVDTENGPVTLKMASQEKVHIKNMGVDVTHIEFGSLYIPKIGQLGMKEVTLVAHHQTGDDAVLPALDVTFSKVSPKVPAPDNEEKLRNQNQSFKDILEDSKDGQLNQAKTTKLKEQNQTNEKTESKDKSSNPSSPPTSPANPSQEDQDPPSDPAVSTQQEGNGTTDPPIDEKQTEELVPSDNQDTPTDTGINTVPDSQDPGTDLPSSNKKDTISEALNRQWGALQKRLDKKDQSITQVTLDLEKNLKENQEKLDKIHSSVLGFVLHMNERDQYIQNLKEGLNQTQKSLEAIEIIHSTLTPLKQLKKTAEEQKLKGLTSKINASIVKAQTLQDQKDQLESLTKDTMTQIKKSQNTILDLLNELLTQRLNKLL